jgi:hypothetical protein
LGPPSQAGYPHAQITVQIQAVATSAKCSLRQTIFKPTTILLNASAPIPRDVIFALAHRRAKLPFGFTSKLDKLTLTLDRPKLSPEDSGEVRGLFIVFAAPAVSLAPADETESDILVRTTGVGQGASYPLEVAAHATGI